jgi:hypothetical protein
MNFICGGRLASNTLRRGGDGRDRFLLATEQTAAVQGFAGCILLYAA